MHRKDYILMTQSVRLGDPLPEGFTPHRAFAEVLEREASLTPRTHLISDNTNAGIGWQLGPVYFQMYLGDNEPKIDPEGRKSRIHWQPLLRQDRPKGWHRAWLDFRIRMTGVAPIKDPEHYEKAWTDHARRHRNKWLKEKGTQWEIITPAYDEFAAAYKKSKKDAALKWMFLSQLKDKLQIHGPLVRLFGIRRKAEHYQPHNPIVAGFACIDAPEAKSSLHFISFIHESVKKTPIGTGLMDEWFRTSIPLGIRFLDFGVFWAQGDPRSWQGFSQFKAQFGIHLIRYPLPLARWTGKWRWKQQPIRAPQTVA